LKHLKKLILNADDFVTILEFCKRNKENNLAKITKKIEFVKNAIKGEQGKTTLLVFKNLF
jgi:hypothetical protein